MIQVAHFKGLLQRNRCVNIHHKNIKNIPSLTAEVFKLVNNIYPLIGNEFFDFTENKYNFREFQK